MVKIPLLHINKSRQFNISSEKKTIPGYKLIVLDELIKHIAVIAVF